jgi:hypothetical protein
VGASGFSGFCAKTTEQPIAMKIQKIVNLTMLPKWMEGMWETVLSEVWIGQLASALVWDKLWQESIEKSR